MQQTTSWGDTQKLLAFVIVVAFIVVIFTWMFFAPKSDVAATAVLNTLVGTLGGFAAMVVSFYFGNSRASANKDQTIANLANPAAPTVPPAPPPTPPA
jgi:uncharacterized YccA/Bax inhibitor family protein